MSIKLELERYLKVEIFPKGNKIKVGYLIREEDKVSSFIYMKNDKIRLEYFRYKFIENYLDQKMLYHLCDYADDFLKCVFDEIKVGNFIYV